MKLKRIYSIVRSKLFRGSLLAVFLFGCVALLSLSGSRVSSQTSTPPQPPRANNEAKPISRMIENAKRSGRNFPTAEPFNGQTRSVATDTIRRRALKAGTVLQLRQNALAELVDRKASSLTLHLPTFGGTPVELELVQVDLFAPRFKVVTSSSQGQAVTYQDGVHYWGVMKGVADSFAAISVFKNELTGSFSSAQGGNFVLGKLAGNNPRRDHILYAETDLTTAMPAYEEMTEESEDDGIAYGGEEFDTSPANVTRCVKIFLETDFDLFLNKGSVQETVNFATAVFNQAAALFSNEGIKISISEIFVWTTPSPYTGGDSKTQLQQFQNVRTSFNGDLAQLLDLQSHQGGIAAGFSGLCNFFRSNRMSYSGLFTFFEQVPTYSWSVNVVTHELGHLFGSKHTHACVWNGNATMIDDCGPRKNFFDGVFCAFFKPRPPLPTNGGTIMSYCHLLPEVGINFANGFGPQPGNVIRNRFNGASCLGTCFEPVPTSGYTTAFQSIGGYFVVAEGGGGGVVNANRGAIGSWETFTLVDLNGGALESGDLVNIQSVGGYFVVAEGGGGDVVNANRTAASTWETFRIERVDGGGTIGSGDAISLQAYNGWAGGGGNYVVAEDGGGSVVNANRGAVGPWETFIIHIW
jgi:hypothetical protein